MSPSILCSQLWGISFRYEWRQYGIAISKQYATHVQCWWGWYQWRGVLFLEENRNNGCVSSLSRKFAGIHIPYLSTLPRKMCTWCCCDLFVRKCRMAFQDIEPRNECTSWDDLPIYFRAASLARYQGTRAKVSLTGKQSWSILPFWRW